MEAIGKGSSVWLFLWLIDKTTSENGGTGKVLGGRPITLNEIADALEISRPTAKRHLHKLAKAGYLKLSYVRIGIAITINKSKKFWKRGVKSDPSGGQICTPGGSDLTRTGVTSEPPGGSDLSAHNKELEQTQRTDNEQTVENGAKAPDAYELRCLEAILEIPGFRRDDVMNLKTVRELHVACPNTDIVDVSKRLGRKVRCGAYSSKNLVNSLMNWVHGAEEKGTSKLGESLEDRAAREARAEKRRNYGK